IEAMNFAIQRARMVEEQLRARGVGDENVLEAMARVPREEFVPFYCRQAAYRDGPLPIGCGQTISQPFIVALMTEALQLRKTDRVLEIGTGSGYQAAILAELCAHVCTIERYPRLAETAADTLRRLGYSNIEIKTGDGSVGLPERAPFDAIVVTASAPVVPRMLINQLADDGRLVIPVGESEEHQRLVRVRHAEGDRSATEDLGPVRFVPLIGEAAWPENHDAVVRPYPDPFHVL
ncbi:MAG: protein-L-isoaspartate(D-aspartate) O-methyltransferase, partial [Hyphomicrobiaceae bacterium]